MSESNCTARGTAINPQPDQNQSGLFAAIPLALIPRLLTAGPAACQVFLALAKHANFSTGECFPSVDTIAKEIGGVHPETVRRAIRALAEVRVLRVERRLRPDGRPNTNLYALELILAPARDTRASASKDSRASAWEIPAQAQDELPPVEPPPFERPKKSARFVPPSLDEVRAYFLEQGTSVDPEEFYAHYQANGWNQGRGRPVKDWRACLVTWKKNQKKFAEERKNGKHTAVPGPGQRHDPGRPLTWG